MSGLSSPGSAESPAPREDGTAYLLRRLTGHDRDTIQSFVAADPDYTRLCLDRDPHSDDADALLHHLPDGVPPEAHLLVGAFDTRGRLVGVAQTVSGWPGPGTRYIGLLQVHPGHRGRAVARRLLADVEHRARLAGQRRLRLGVIRRNGTALRFWVHQGFEVVDDGVARAAGPLDAVPLHRYLPGGAPGRPGTHQPSVVRAADGLRA